MTEGKRENSKFTMFTQHICRDPLHPIVDYLAAIRVCTKLCVSAREQQLLFIELLFAML